MSTAASSGNAGGGAGRIAETSASASSRFRCSAARTRTAQSRSVSAVVSSGRAAAGSSAVSASSAAVRATYRPSRCARLVGLEQRRRGVGRLERRQPARRGARAPPGSSDFSRAVISAAALVAPTFANASSTAGMTR